MVYEVGVWKEATNVSNMLSMRHQSAACRRLTVVARDHFRWDFDGPGGRPTWLSDLGPVIIPVEVFMSRNHDIKIRTVPSTKCVSDCCFPYRVQGFPFKRCDKMPHEQLSWFGYSDPSNCALVGAAAT